MPKRNRWLLVLGISLFLPAAFCAFFAQRSQEKYDQFLFPNPLGKGSYVIESHLGRLNFHFLPNMTSFRPNFFLRGWPARHSTVIAVRSSQNLSSFYAKRSYEWGTLRFVGFLAAAAGFAVCLLLILINGNSRNTEAVSLSS